MSLFQIQEWMSSLHPNAFALCVAKLVGDRDQLIIGTLDGLLTVLDPGREPEHRNELGGMAELHLTRPILQLSVGQFLPATFPEQPILAALLPSSLLYFRLTQTAESFVCEQVFEHRIPGPPAFNMCQGHFGRSSAEQMCVQSLQGHLSLFEAENRILQRLLPDILHPGPVDYSAVTESLLVASGGYLRSIRYATLISTGTKQVNVDWMLPLGDSALQMRVLNGSGPLQHHHHAPLNATQSNANTSQNDHSSSSRPNSSVHTGSPVQPSVLVLCKRILHCVTHGGNLRFSIRLQTVALSLRVLGHARESARIPMVISTGGNMLLFYMDTLLIWTVQLPFVAQIVDICTFSESLRSLLALLSDDGRLFVGYLGTEPSLFRMPATESRFIDFDERKRELRELEEAIWRSGREKPEGKDSSGIEISFGMDGRSVAFHSADGIPSATVLLAIQPDSFVNSADLLLNSELCCPNGSQFQLKPRTANFTFSLFPNEQMVLDRRCQLAFHSNALHFMEFLVPLPLICQEVPAQRQAAFKLSLDSTQPVLPISTLFPGFSSAAGNEDEGEMGSKNNAKTSIGLQPFFGDQNSIVSVFISTKTNRYRIQSDRTDFVFVIFAELVDQIRKSQPEARLHCPVPMHTFLGEIAKQIDLEKECVRLEKEAARCSTQMRQVETVFLGKLKANDREQGHQHGGHMNALVNYSYRELTDCLDRLNEMHQIQFGPAKRRSLRSLLNLMHAILQLNELHLPFDGRILDGTDQNLGDRIAQLLCPPEETLGANMTSTEICRLLASFCEQGAGQLGGIVEEEEEEIEGEEGGEKEQKMLAEVIAKSEAYLEFAQLESGSMQARNL